MSKIRVFTLLSAVSMCAALTATARADEWDQKTTVKINQAIEVPGTVLQPGTYTFRLLDSAADRHVVQIMNSRENHVFATIQAINTERLTPTGETVFTFYETPAGQPPAMKDWYYPGNNFGQQFVYKNHNFEKVSTAQSQAVQAAPVAENTPPPPPPAVAETAPAPAPAPEIAQNEAPAAAPPAPEQPAPAPATLPQTASNIPLLTLIGLLSLGAAAGLGSLSKKVG